MRLFLELQDQIMLRHQQQLRRLHASRAAIEAAEELAFRLRSCGATAGTRGETDDDGCTVVVFTACAPAIAEALLDNMGINRELIDMHDSPLLSIRTYRVSLRGEDVSLVATQHHGTESARAYLVEKAAA